MRRRGYLSIAAALAAGTLALTACSSSGSNSSSSSPSTFGVNATGTVHFWARQATDGPAIALVKEFNKTHKHLKVVLHLTPPNDDTSQLATAIRAGSPPDVVGLNDIDVPTFSHEGALMDLTKYINALPYKKSLSPGHLALATIGSKYYGLPYLADLSVLWYNKKLFSEAGLNPNDPPTTWAQVETDAKAIAKLGHGIEGWGDYSAGNNGGWHFASYMDALGGTTVNTNNAPPTAAFNNANGLAILDALHTLRFTDNAMSATQGLAWGALQQQFAAGKLGMYIAAPDDIYNVIVPTDKGNINDIGMGPLPSLTGTPAGSLGGGNAYVFAKRDTPAQIEAGIKFIDFEDLTPGKGTTFNFARLKADGIPVGFDEPSLFDGAAGAQVTALRNKYSTINQSYYQSYVKANEASDGEPFDAQAVYKTLDPMMLAVLTEPNVNIPALLKTSAANVNTLLQFSS